MREPPSIWIRGIVAGAIGAAALALWFFLVDLSSGAPLRTPAMLGAALFGVENLDGNVGLLVLFTVLHFAAFMGVGALTAWTLSQMEVVPNFLAGLLLGFILFDILFFGSAWATGINVIAALGWVEVLAGNLIGGLTVVGVLHLTGVGKRVSWWSALRERRVLREGVIVGIAAGFLVATWFLLVDVLQGRPFFTPTALGSVFFFGLGDLSEVEPSLWVTAAYTPIHYAVFIGIGALASAMAGQVERQPPALVGVILLFVAFQAFFLGVVAVLAESLLGTLAWWNIAIGNLVAVVTIVTYLWRVHPQLKAVMDGRLIEGEATQ